MWTGHAECYGVTPVVAVVPLLNQILSILNKRTLLIRLTRQLQIQVHRGQLRVQVRTEHVSATGTTGTSTSAGVSFLYKYRGMCQLQVQIHRQGPRESTECTVIYRHRSATGTNTQAGVTSRYTCIGKL
jgi:hypothetical protein